MAGGEGNERKKKASDTTRGGTVIKCELESFLGRQPRVESAPIIDLLAVDSATVSCDMRCRRRVGSHRHISTAAYRVARKTERSENDDP